MTTLSQMELHQHLHISLRPALRNMKYQYTLDCYNENGKKRELKFKTSRELKEDAFLKLEVKTFGVHSWEEVQYNELPEKVQANYTK